MTRHYHQREHSALNAESPAGRFHRLGTNLRLLAPGAPLERWFGHKIQRRVRMDATFALDGRFWEVATHLRGRVIDVYYDPIHYTRVEYGLNNAIIGQARLCNKIRNAQLP